ncbi:MAG: RAD55 family ATPase [Halobacteriota archaeon]|nr:RAD55 family ATPase [Halobacteriota archaeon]
MEKVISGISSLDSILGGGITKGSVILLLGEVGSGYYEFAFTSAITNSVKNGGSEDESHAPGVSYLSMTRSIEDIEFEIQSSFSDMESGAINIIDFSESYFSNSNIPLSWITDDMDKKLGLLGNAGSNNGVLRGIVDCLDERADSNIIVLDSLTALTRVYRSDDEWGDFIKFLQGLQRISKQWGGIIYLILTANIFDNSREEEIADVVDGVFHFKWEDKGTGERRRSMFIKKLRGDVPRLESLNLSWFDVVISSSDGLDLEPIRHILVR